MRNPVDQSEPGGDLDIDLPLLRADTVFVGHTRRRRLMRRVVATYGSRVYYSTGGDRVHDCLKTTLYRWIQVREATVTNIPKRQ